MSDKSVFSEKTTPSFTIQIDAAAVGLPQPDEPPVSRSGAKSEMGVLFRQMLIGQTRLLAAIDRQNDLLTKMNEQLSAAGRQRAAELAAWKQANPRLARACKDAAEKLGRVQTDFIDSIADEIDVNFDSLANGDFFLNEFVDRFGPRFVHLNTILQVLSQLGNAPSA